MRWIVITLVVINVAYFAWQQQFAAAPVPEIAKPFVATDEQLRLASEFSEDAEPAADVEEPLLSDEVVVEQTLSTTEVVPHPPAIACYSVGPFSLVNDISSTAKIFEGDNTIATQQRAAAERNQIGYWVYIPPQESLQAARMVLRDLQDKEVRDALIIAEGTKANAISAGIYNVEENAQERRDSIIALGYQAELEPLYRTQPQYWLDVELMESQAIPAKLWQKVSRRFPNITQTPRPCE